MLIHAENNLPRTYDVATYSHSHVITVTLNVYKYMVRPRSRSGVQSITARTTIASGRPRLPFFVALPSHPPVVRCSRVPSHEAGLLYGLRSADEPRFCGLGVALEGERRGRGEPLACLLIKTCTV